MRYSIYYLFLFQRTGITSPEIRDQYYEGHVHSDQGWNMSGASFFGRAFPSIGHNEYLAWSHTVNDPDVVDVYEETFDNPQDSLAYRYGGAYRKATEWRESVGVKTAIR